MTEPDAKLRHGAEQRLEFIEFRLYWDGRVNRADLTRQFGVSTPQASADLSRYQDLAPGNMVYSPREKCYLPAESFRPRFFAPDAGRYLTFLEGLNTGVIAREDAWLSTIPATGVVPIPSRRVAPAILRAFVGAVRRRRAINILYQSMSAHRPEPIWRWITPHAFGFDGMRWHVRAFCHIESKFKDFILSRCVEVGAEGDPGAPPEQDHQWNAFFEVVLIANPDLSEPQRRIIEQDYDMTGGRLALPVRASMLYYLEKRLRLDIAAVKDRPQETPVVVENADAFREYLAKAKAP